MTYLHTDIRVTHTTIHGQIGQLMPTVLFHRIEDGLGLVASGLHCRTGNVTALSMLRNTDCEKLVKIQR